MKRFAYRSRAARPASVVLYALALTWPMASGCSQTVESKPAVIAQMQTGTLAAAVSGFFGNSYSLLQPGQKGQAALVYVNPSAQWKQYMGVMLEPVQFWDGPESKISPTDQHILAAYFYNQLKKDLEAHFTMVDQGGPGILVLQVALTNASAATPGLRSVSIVVPQLRLLNSLQSLATGSYAFVGSAEGQMKVTDSVTGQLLAAAIDKRAGGASLSSAAQWEWGDAENAMNYWSAQITKRLLELQGRDPAGS
jgi:Protein of unknown function (DUF3313)